MTVSIKSFLVLEQSLSNRIQNSWRRDIASLTREILDLVDAGNFTEAVDICEGFSLAKAAEDNRRFTEFVGMQAALFGASRLSGDPRKSVFMEAGRPDEIKLATNNMMIMMEENATQSVCRLATEMLLREEVDQQEFSIKKDATPKFPRNFVSSVNKNGKSFIDIGSSLHTSRLASWGFTQEATARSITQFQINERLDGRTCPVCQTMHGRTFDVAQAQTKLENWMSTSNPDDMKSVAPWPSQSAKNVALLGQMTKSQIQDKGWDTPPFHPLCRGVLVRAGTITRVQPAEVTPINENVVPTDDELRELTALQLDKKVTGLAKDMVGLARESDSAVTQDVTVMADELGMTFPAKKLLFPGIDGLVTVEDGSVIYNRLKDLKQTKGKIFRQMEKYGITEEQAAERISDSLRYTFVAEPEEYVNDIRAVMERFRNLGYKNASFESTWDSRPEYKGVNINLITPQGLQIEVQFHTPSSVEMKSVNHKIYKVWRKMNPDDPEAQELFAEMVANAEAIERPAFMDFMDDLVAEFNGPSG